MNRSNSKRNVSEFFFFFLSVKKRAERREERRLKATPNFNSHSQVQIELKESGQTQYYFKCNFFVCLFSFALQIKSYHNLMP